MKINSVFSKALAVATVVATSIGFQSCLDDDDNNAYYLRYPNALVTVTVRLPPLPEGENADIAGAISVPSVPSSGTS